MDGFGFPMYSLYPHLPLQGVPLRSRMTYVVRLACYWERWIRGWSSG